MSRTSRRALALLAGALLVLLPALPAQAHDRLEASSPADGDAVRSAPAQVVLTFSSPPVALGSKVVVTGPDGGVVSAGDARFVDTTVAQPLAGDLPAGEYRVEWRVTSSDGHPVSGTFAYTAASPAAGGASAAPSSAAPSAPASPSTSAAAPASPAAGPAAGRSDGSSSGTPGWVVAGGAVAALAVVAGAAAAVLRRR